MRKPKPTRKRLFAVVRAVNRWLFVVTDGFCFLLFSWALGCREHGMKKSHATARTTYTIAVRIAVLKTRL